MALECPLSKNPIIDPVTAPDGFTYERKALQKYIRKYHKSPVTGEPLDGKTLNSFCKMRGYYGLFLPHLLSASAIIINSFLVLERALLAVLSMQINGKRGFGNSEARFGN